MRILKFNESFSKMDPNYISNTHLLLFIGLAEFRLYFTHG